MSTTTTSEKAHVSTTVIAPDSNSNNNKNMNLKAETINISITQPETDAGTQDENEQQIQHEQTVMNQLEEKTITRRLLFKLDTRILPVFVLLVLCSFLDRTNVGNAKLYGLEKDLGMSNAQYITGLAVFYPLYIAAEIPSNLLLIRFTPSLWIALLTFCWGIFCLFTGLTHTFSQFLALRALLGLAEGGLFPGMVLYLSGMYTRSELALRIGVLYTATSLSGAFGGLLARAMAGIGDRGGLVAWRWIFVVEGVFTLLVAGFTWFVLPDGIDKAGFLSREERAVGEKRLRLASGTGTGRKEGDERFRLGEVGRGVASVQTLLTAGAYFGLLSGIYSFGLFLPTIIKDLGYTANEAQLWSVIPYAVAACTTLAIAFLSDRLRLRGIVMLCTMPIAIVGYAAMANLPAGNTHPKTKYGMTFLMAVGIYSSVPPNLAWLANNSAGHYKRATASALQLAIANCGGILAVFLYPDADGPSYHRGHTVVLGLLVAGWFLILGNVLYCAQINRDKARGLYDKYIGYGDDKEPGFKMVM